MRFWLAGLIGLVLATFSLVGPVQAQAPAGSPGATTTPVPAQPPRNMFPPRAADAPVAQPPSGPIAGLYGWIAQQMRAFNQALAKALRDIKAGNPWAASLVLLGVSFAYGILHAAGPGHGKMIVSSYMLADGQTVRRGIKLAFLSSLVQALSAITIFTIVILVLKGARTQITATEAFLERASWAIVALFGLWLLYRQVRALITGRPAHDHHHGHAHGHSHAHDHHGHAHDHGRHAHHHDHEHGRALAHAGHTAHHHSHDAAHRTHHHDHHHGHAHRHDHAHAHNHSHGEACADCGHAHMPTADALQGAWSWRRAATMALAIGIRPCTGAILVLFLANSLGLLWAGIASTFVMSLGTAITVSALAALTVGSRELATRLAGTADNSWAARAQTVISLAGAALVFVLGASFFVYSLSNPTPF